MKEKKITLIAPCYNEEKNLKQFFDSLLNQSNKNFDIIIIDDGSTDNSLNIIKKYIKLFKELNIDLKILFGGHNGPANAKKIGISKSITDYIAIVDTDEELDKNYFLNFYLYLEKNNFNFLSGIIFAKKNGVLSTTSNLIYKMFYKKRIYGNGRFIKWLAGGNIIINKKILLNIGGYPLSKTGIAEDILLSQQIKSNGLKINFLEFLIVYHKDPENILEYLTREYKFGIGFNLSLIKGYKFGLIEYFKISSLILLLIIFISLKIFIILFFLYYLLIVFYLFKSSKSIFNFIAAIQIYFMNVFWSLGFVKGFIKYIIKKD